MIKSIWEKIKLAFNREPTGVILKPFSDLPRGTIVTVEAPSKPVVKVKRTYVRKSKV